MALVPRQAQFSRDIAQLILFANEQGYDVTMGEVQRMIEMQAIYVRSGRSKTMNSMHLKKLAADLFFFKRESNGKRRFVQDKCELQQFGDYWESLTEGNVWGGNWQSFKDVPHFQAKR